MHETRHPDDFPIRGETLTASQMKVKNATPNIGMALKNPSQEMISKVDLDAGSELVG